MIIISRFFLILKVYTLLANGRQLQSRKPGLRRKTFIKGARLKVDCPSSSCIPTTAAAIAISGYCTSLVKVEGVFSPFKLPFKTWSLPDRTDRPLASHY